MHSTLGRTVVRRTRLAIVATVAACALLGGGSSAQADPPPGWEPGASGTQADFADVGWTHQGRYQGMRGNWHTGYVNVEEDDDVLTVVLNDWWCPRGVTPPSPYQDATVDTRCTRKSGKEITYYDWWDVADFDQARNRLTVRGNFTDSVDTDTVRLDLAIQGKGRPAVTQDTSNGLLYYSEVFENVHATGRVDGHRVDGPRTTQEDGMIRFYLDSWSPIP
jgi:hypothetical protein